MRYVVVFFRKTTPHNESLPPHQRPSRLLLPPRYRRTHQLNIVLIDRLYPVQMRVLSVLSHLRYRELFLMTQIQLMNLRVTLNRFKWSLHRRFVYIRNRGIRPLFTFMICDLIVLKVRNQLVLLQGSFLAI